MYKNARFATKCTKRTNCTKCTNCTKVRFTIQARYKDICLTGETLGAQKKMNTTQRILHLAPRPTLRISEVERLIRVHRIVIPPLSRRSLYEMCEQGVFEFAPREKTHGYYIYEDSFLAWVEERSKKA